MALKRIIPCLLYDGKGLVKTTKFKNPNYIGDPMNAIKIFNEKEVDELILLDIYATKEKRRINLSKIADFAGECFMPFAYGGGVKTTEEFYELYKIGVEKELLIHLFSKIQQLLKKPLINMALRLWSFAWIIKKTSSVKSRYFHLVGIRLSIHLLIL